MNIYCPHCQQILEITNELFGQTVQCGKCSGLIDLIDIPENRPFKVIDPYVAPPVPSLHPSIQIIMT